MTPTILHVGTMTADEVLAQGLTDAVSFRTHDGSPPRSSSTARCSPKTSAAASPRTAIGQCADGSVLLLVLDGRSINTLGATMQDVADIMLEYGAVNASISTAGSSSVMVYDGEIINNCASVTGKAAQYSHGVYRPAGGGLSMEEKKTQVPSGAAGGYRRAGRYYKRSGGAGGGSLSCTPWCGALRLARMRGFLNTCA